MVDEQQMTIADMEAMESLPARIESVLLLRLRRDGGTQMRRSMDMGATQEYAEALARGEEFPPVVVYDDGTDIWLSDGFHRYDAHTVAGRKLIECEVRQGTRQDAILWAAKANRAHGVRLTPADREKIVITLVTEFPSAIQADIARMAAMGDSTVAAVARRLNLQIGNSPRGRPRKETLSVGDQMRSEAYTAVAELEDAFDGILADFEEKAREELKSLLTAPGVPNEVALEAARNAAAMSDEKRAHVVELIASDDPKDQRAAIAAVRNLPYVHPLWSRVNTSLGHMRHCLPAARGTEFEGACKIIVDHLEGLVEAIEENERSTEDATAQS